MNLNVFLWIAVCSRGAELPTALFRKLIIGRNKPMGVVLVKEIPLTQGMVALVDDDNYEWLSQYKWCANKNKKTYYAMRHAILENGKKTMVSMHQEILGMKPGHIVDHRDGNGLKNIRSNLRHVTPRQNAQNLHIPKSSKYPGVYWNKCAQKWHVRIRANRTCKHIGYYTNELNAFLAYQKAVKELGDDTSLLEAYL